MQKKVIQELIKEANKSPSLKYNENLLVFKENLKEKTSHYKTQPPKLSQYPYGLGNK